MIEQQQHSWASLLAILGGATAAIALLCYKWNQQQPPGRLLNHRKQLFIQIEEAYQHAQDKCWRLEPLKTKILKGDGLTLEIQFIPLLAEKNKLPTTKPKADPTPSQIVDPFMPPFEKGKLICELPPRHSLLFNKYYYCVNHLLIITREFEEQTDPLNLDDWRVVSSTIRSLGGLAFFNCGVNAGFSQSHKHIQILPAEGFNFPIVQRLTSAVQKKELLLREPKEVYFFRPFKFVHGIALLPQQCSPHDYLKLYTRLRAYLEEVVGGKFDYNLLATDRFILMVPRRCEYILGKRISVSSCIFLGLILVNTEDILEDLEKRYPRPAQIFEQLTFKWRGEQALEAHEISHQ